MENLDYILQNDTLVFKFYGEIDCYKVKDLKDRIIREVKAHDVSLVKFDFANISFIDSSGIGLILGRYNELNKKGIRLEISKVNSLAKKLFQISGIDKIIKIYEEVEI